jgi:hypothetical protein
MALNSSARYSDYAARPAAPLADFLPSARRPRGNRISVLGRRIVSDQQRQDSGQ